MFSARNVVNCTRCSHEFCKNPSSRCTLGYGSHVSLPQLSSGLNQRYTSPISVTFMIVGGHKKLGGCLNLRTSILLISSLQANYIYIHHQLIIRYFYTIYLDIINIYIYNSDILIYLYIPINLYDVSLLMIFQFIFP